MYFDVSLMFLGCIFDVPWMYLATISYLPKDKNAPIIYNFELSILNYQL